MANLIKTTSIAVVDGNPNEVAELQAMHNFTEAVSVDGTQRWNFLPANAEGNKWVLRGSGGGSIQVTLTQLNTLISTNSLEVGLIYEISGVQPFLYGGTTIWLKAIFTNQLEEKGIGKFYVPKYDKNIDGYGIWGGKLYNAGLISQPTYSVNDKVIWGGKVWKNLTGSLGTEVDIFSLDAVNWQVIPFDEVDYNIEYDEIRYDIYNDCINYRKDKSNNEMNFSYNWWYQLENYMFNGDMLNSKINPIKSFQWGNHFSHDFYRGNMINICNSSFIENINEFGSYYNNVLENNGQIYSNILGSDGYINSNILENNGQIYSNIINNGQIYSNILENDGLIFSNTLRNNGRIFSNVLENSGQIFSNVLENDGRINTNTLNGGKIFSNTLNNGKINFNTLKINGQINFNTLKINGQINSNTLKINGQINSNTLENNGQINSNTLENNGQIRLGILNTINNKIINNLTINTGDIGGDDGINLSTATLIYQTYERIVFKNSAGVTKIRYIDGGGNTVVADLTD